MDPVGRHAGRPLPEPTRPRDLDLYGSLELSDGTFLWPEGLCHYVSEHAVRLPGDFVRHIISISTQMKDADIDDSWWKAQQCP